MQSWIFGKIPSHAQIYALERQLVDARAENWLKQDLFSPQWWLLLLVLIIPWFLWWHYVDRKRLLEISLFGAIVLIITSYLDAVMSDLGFWSYHYHIIYVWPRLISADFTVVPVIYMLVYQYFREWKRFLLAMTAVSLFFAYAGEPFLIWLNIYELRHWKHIYSLPIYLAMGILVRCLLNILLARQAGCPPEALENLHES